MGGGGGGGGSRGRGRGEGVGIGEGRRGGVAESKYAIAKHTKLIGWDI